MIIVVGPAVDPEEEKIRDWEKAARASAGKSGDVAVRVVPQDATYLMARQAALFRGTITIFRPLRRGSAAATVNHHRFITIIINNHP